MSDIKCAYPYTHLNFKANGQVAVCNRSQPQGSIHDYENINDFLVSTDIYKLRHQINEGAKPKSCEACWILEESSANSYRQESLRKDSTHAKWLSLNNNKPIVREVELRFGNLCNLQCLMCSPKFSSKWEKLCRDNTNFSNWISSDSSNSDIYDLNNLEDKKSLLSVNKKILDFIHTHHSQLKYVMISGGEPLLQKDHYQALQYLLPSAEDITLEYTTNLNTLTFESHKVLDLWKKFKRVLVKISLDADPNIYSYIRAGGDIQKVVNNIDELRHLDNLKLIGTCTTSIYNIDRLDLIMQFFSEIGIYAHTSIVEYPTFLSPQILPNELRKSCVSKLQKFINNIHQLPHHKELDRDLQLERTIKWTQSCLNFISSDKDLNLWKKFLKFNSFFDPGNQKLSKFYPNWKSFL